MSEDEFEWDVAKAASNLVKHGVSFEAACRVFDDAFAFELFDLESEPGEIRYVVTGMVGDVVLTVVYTERGSESNHLSKEGDES